MQIITYILTVCCAAVLGVNMQGEAKSHKSKEHKERREEKKARRHEKKHHKDKDAPIVITIPPAPSVTPESPKDDPKLEINVIPGKGIVE